MKPLFGIPFVILDDESLLPKPKIVLGDLREYVTWVPVSNTDDETHEQTGGGQ